MIQAKNSYQSNGKNKNHNTKIKPVQMIKFDQNKNIFITDQAIDLFNKMTSQQLHIITVAGKYRTGKSYILNRVLLQQNQGFQVGPTINACTKGLWMWPQLIKIGSNGQQKDCLIVDTEGLGSLQQGQNTDLKIFLMATLISSYLIYNSVGSIDQKAIESLNLVVNLANVLQKQNSSYDCQQLINSFPSFMWLVRDFSLKLQNVNGEEITSQEYLQNALKQQKGSSKMIQKKNEVRKQLKTFFKERDCFTLIRPTLSQIDLQNLSAVPQKKLRPQFVRLVSELKLRIHNSLKPKRIRGKVISPQGFIQLCNYYIKTINSGKLPSISSHWDNLCLSESSRLINKYRLIHKEKLLQIQELIKDKIQEKQIEKLHNLILNQGKQYIEKSFLGKLQRQLSKQKLDKLLTQNLLQVLSRIRAQKSNKRQIQMKIFKFFECFDHIEQFQNKQQIIQAIQSSYEHFQKLQQFINKQKEQNSHIYQHFYLSSKQAISKALYYLQNIQDSKIFSFQNKIDSLSLRIQALQGQKLSQSQSYEEKIKIMQKKMQIVQFQNTSLKMLLQKKIKECQCQQLSKKYDQRFLQQKIRQQEDKKIIEQLKNQNCRLKDLNSKNQKQFLLLQDQKDKKQIIFLQTNCKIRQVSINLRKKTRQYQVIKNKLLESQKDNAVISQENQKMKINIENLQSSIRKNKNLAVSSKFEKQNKNFITHQLQLKRMFYKIEQLELANRQYKHQKDNLQKFLLDQKQMNRILMQTPHNINYLSLKKNYQFQKLQILKLKETQQKYEKMLNHISRFQCSLCKQLFQKNLMFEHYQNCINRWSIDFDISYQISNDHQIWFIFQISVEQHLRSKQQINAETSLYKWQIRKNIDNVKLLMKKLNKKFQVFQAYYSKKEQTNIQKVEQKYKKSIDQNELFAQNQLNNSISVVKKTYVQLQTQYEDQDVNLNQERRLFIDQVCRQIKSEIFFNKFLIQFFGFDIHLLTNFKRINKKFRYEKKKDQIQIGEQFQQDSPSYIAINMSRSPSNNQTFQQCNLFEQKQTKKKKIQKNYRLNMGDVNGQNEKQQDSHWNMINLGSSRESVNFLKTTKFTKKSFNFKLGSNMI